MSRFLFSVAASFALALPVAGQEVCDLRLRLFDDGKSVSAGKAEASARELKSGSVSFVHPEDEQKIFRDLQPAIYRITVRHPEYRWTEFSYGLECKAESTGTAARSVDVPLWKDGDEETIAVYDKDGDGKLVKIEGPIFEVKQPSQGDSKKDPRFDGAASSAIDLAKARHPAAARALNAVGSVQVAVIIAEDGSVVFSKALSGHPLLRGAAVDAALLSRFKSTTINGIPVKISGIIVFNFR
ncbi:MAG TPA: energy transducer TonB [Aridibacter sp.]|nr:energy transducer TonB [Aridibacter sp.]